MNNRARNRRDIDHAIEKSAGRAFLDREYARSFSLNIFRTNAVELVEALKHLSDPEHGLHLMAQNNREAGTQAHREISRRVHNYVAAAKSLVDHTRVFINENYGRSNLKHKYNSEVKKRFQENPVAKFVHDLRNYMLHRGLPNSSMFLRYSQDPERPELGAQITTGVKINAEALRDWDGWTAPARAYLETVGAEVSIEDFASTYLSQVEAFQEWISKQLAEFHSDDMAELDALQEEYALSEPKLENTPQKLEEDEMTLSNLQEKISDNFYIPPEISNAADAMGADLLKGICKLTLQPVGEQDFKSDRPVSIAITPDKMIDQPVVFREDANGKEVIAFIYKDHISYGFRENSINILHNIIDSFQEVPWMSRSLSKKFLHRTIIDWCRLSFLSNEAKSLTDAIILSSRNNIKTYEVWVPIDHLEIEIGFSFGPVQIRPITSDMLNKLEQNGISLAPTQEVDVRSMFERLRSTMQGYAAVMISLDATPDRAGSEGIKIAREAIDLLRFFSPAAANASLYCPTCLLGNGLVPTNHVLVLGEGSFSYIADGVPPDTVHWRMSKAKLTELQRAFAETGKLVNSENLDDFERSVRSSMVLFGMASTFRDLNDRLMYTLSAAEGILLKHELEPTAYSVQKRMSQILQLQGRDPDEISRVVRAIYRFRARHGSLRWSDFEKDTLQDFVSYTQTVLLVALGNISYYGTRGSFIEAIEEISGEKSN